ncbi:MULTISPECIES: diacylglycerol kinase [unclassified Rhizobium]|jgi:diacylglycerol kinase (ATP)|uniref:diacylglycerol kinase n=1 Tax=unclassified Rhizobium TaxID=2613769 RepID=UPI00035EF169|nr:MULTISPECIES: diacylglycerol kinase [unclassified Rhizobium]MBO9124542.1 diacylglycerol kinase [Rhizobium sp. 16-488-2b]MBO9175078.1 diacylglycerol kinase [Rhizobium sp. 16-488-2a]MBO9194481.1 diacylglycerol kinase [Rhizobium sp. 16-449-1b]
MKPAVTKLTGISHFFAAASYSLGGFKRLIKEAAFRQELLFAAVALILLLAVGATLVELMIAVVLFLIVFAIEALNTAIEEVIDRISPEISSVGKHAKDLGSFAVLCMLTACGIFMLFTIGKHLMFG